MATKNVAGSTSGWFSRDDSCPHDIKVGYENATVIKEKCIRCGVVVKIRKKQEKDVINNVIH